MRTFFRPAVVVDDVVAVAVVAAAIAVVAAAVIVIAAIAVVVADAE